jgi:class 3 adenylate cyclase
MPGGAGGDERKIATVLFADLTGSTALADQEDPERVRARLERFYSAMQAELELAGGTVEKFAGDAVMAAFGVPVAQEDHAERALHAALAMQRRLQELFGDELGLRVGVNSGEVVTGSPREGSSFVSGDPVNVAARLEQAAASGEVLAGERTVAAVRGAFEFGDPQTIDAKGKPGGIACRRLVRALTLQRPRGVGGLPAVFVGREEQLAQLRDAYERVGRERSPRLIAIVGEAGVGKTRLVRELWQWLAAREPQPLQRTGRCLSYGQIAYWALGEILKEHFGLLETDAPETVLARLRGREILGLALGLDVAGDLHPLVARDRFQDAWATLLEELAADRPVAILVEDVHWAEEPLLELLEQLLETVRGPLLVIATGRPELFERRPGFGSRSGAVTIALEPLSVDAGDRLLAELLGGKPPPGLASVVARAEGNPFFVEEALASLIDQGLLERSDEGWVLHEQADGYAIPDTVQAVVAARIDLLLPAEKASLQAASVIGRVFWSGPVYELCEGHQPDLRVLEERDFVRRRHGSAVEGEREYAIKHAVTREVAYASIPKARRAHLHAAFAGWLERFGSGRDEHAPLLAHHYAEAARPEDADLAWSGEVQELERLRARAVTWLGRAAELAVARYDIDEALGELHRALGLEPDRDDARRIWKAIGAANALKFDGEAFWTAMQQAIELSEESEAGELYSLLAYHTATRAGMWRTLPDQSLIDGWTERALALGEPGSSAQARALVAKSWSHTQPDEEAAREASRMAESIDDLGLRLSAWMARAGAAFNALRFDEAAAWAQRQVEVADELGDPDQRLEIYESIIPATASIGRFAEGRRFARKHAELAARLTPHHRVHGASVLMEAEESAADWGRVLELVPDVEAAMRENDRTPCVRSARDLLLGAVASEVAGDPERARALESTALETGFESHHWALAGPRIRLALVRGDRDRLAELVARKPPVLMVFGPDPLAARIDGLAALRDVVRLEDEAPLLLTAGTYVEPFALRALGIVRGDDELLAQADERFAALGLDWHRAQTEKLMSV